MAKKNKKNQPVGETLAKNRKASHEFELLLRFEAGMALLGPEVKSARAGRVNLKEGYVRIKNGEVFLEGAHFSPYTNAREPIDPVRSRKLLLHAREIRKLSKETVATGMTIVPTRLYLKNGRIKLEIAIARGKKLYDKRESLKRKSVEREMRRETGTLR